MPIAQMEFFPNMRANVLLVTFVVVSACCDSGITGELKLGSSYRIIRPLYLMAVYDDVDNKRINRTTVSAYLHSEQLAHRYFVAFQVEVPVGTVMTILGAAPTVCPGSSLFAKRYYVQLTPDVARGLNVQIELDFDMQGNLDGLNSEIFEREDTTF